MFKNNVMIGILVLCFIPAALAALEEESRTTVVVKEMKGEVSGISSSFIAILYGQDKNTSYEMAFTMDKNVKLEDKKSLKEIEPRDIVTVSYEETSETKKVDDKEVTRVMSRVVKRIRFVRAGTKLQENDMRSVEGSEATS